MTAPWKAPPPGDNGGGAGSSLLDGLDNPIDNPPPAGNQTWARPPIEELLRGSFETPEWADDPLEPSGDPESGGDPEPESEPADDPPWDEVVMPLGFQIQILVSFDGRPYGTLGPVQVDKKGANAVLRRLREVVL